MSQLQTNGTVSSEMLVKALIRQFVSTSNLRGKKRVYSFSRTGKCLVSVLIESLLTGLSLQENKKFQQLPSSEFMLYNEEGLGSA